MKLLILKNDGSSAFNSINTDGKNHQFFNLKITIDNVEAVRPCAFEDFSVDMLHGSFLTMPPLYIDEKLNFNCPPIQDFDIWTRHYKDNDAQEKRAAIIDYINSRSIRLSCEFYSINAWGAVDSYPDNFKFSDTIKIEIVSLS